MNIANFKVDNKKCTGCGLCVKVCPGGILSIGEDRKSHMNDGVSVFGWDGCWKCQRCLAVCPVAAVSLLGKRPEDSNAPPVPSKSAPILDAIMANRRSCRRFLNRSVSRKTIDEMLSVLGNAPNGGNKQLVDYALVDDKEQMKLLRDMAYAKMEQLASEGIYAEGFDKKSYAQMKAWEKTSRPDMLFCSAPNLLIPHAPLGVGCPVQDVNIACAYFELLCASRGLGAIMMTYPLSVLDLMPDIKAMMGIPADHYIAMLIGFGYPEIKYARGTQRGDLSKVTTLHFECAQTATPDQR